MSMGRVTVGLFFIVLLFSCSDRRQLEQIGDPPLTPLLSIETRWAVISSAYVPVYDVAAANAVVLGHYRKGTVIPVSRRISLGSGPDQELWLHTEGEYPGWVRENDCLVYDSRPQAQTASRGLLE